MILNLIKTLLLSQVIILHVHKLFIVTRSGTDIYLLNIELSATQLNDINNNVQFNRIINDPEITMLPPIKNIADLP